MIDVHQFKIDLRNLTIGGLNELVRTIQDKKENRLEF